MDEDIFEVDVAEEDDDSELYHHGIRGQAWGVQNGPPYPLGSAGKSAFAKMKSILKTDSRGRLKAKRAADQASLNKKLVAARIKGRTANTADIKNMVQNVKAKNSLAKARNEGKISKEQYKTEKAKIRAERAMHKAMQKTAEGKNTPKRLTAKEELKQRVINSGDPRMLNKYGKYLNADEYKAASDRIMMKYDLANARMGKFADKLHNFANVSSEGINSYNNIRNVLVAIKPSLSSALPKVGDREKSATERLSEEKANAQLKVLGMKNKDFKELKAGTSSNHDAQLFKYQWAAKELSKTTNKDDLLKYAKSASAEEKKEILKILGVNNP